MGLAEQEQKCSTDVLALLNRLSDTFRLSEFSRYGFPAEVLDISPRNKDSGLVTLWEVIILLTRTNPLCVASMDESTDTRIELLVSNHTRFPHHLQHEALFQLIVCAFVRTQGISIASLLSSFREDGQVWHMLSSITEKPSDQELVTAATYQEELQKDLL